jgi:hypothetical protein
VANIYVDIAVVARWDANAASSIFAKRGIELGEVFYDGGGANQW